MSRERLSQRTRAEQYIGRHELGQNFLVDRRVADTLATIVRHAPPMPILELGAGRGALTQALVETGRPVTAVELDPRCCANLRRSYAGKSPAVRVVEADLLTVDYGPFAHHVASNVPFGITTPLLRRLLSQRYWHTAALLVQWEVARKRAAVGGTTMLTAAWWPWYTFTLAGRVPATAFRPVPSVSAGILVLRRRDEPLVPDHDRARYQRFVKEAFTGRQPMPRRALPRDLDAAQWASLFRGVAADGSPTRGRGERHPGPHDRRRHRLRRQ